MDRSRSTDQVASLGSDGSRDGRSHSADGKGKEVSSATDSKPLPFIRPADIYKRLAEEKAGQRGQTQDAGRLPDEASQQVGPSHPDPASKTSPPTSMQAHDGVAYNDDRGLHPLDPATESQPGNEELKSTTNSSREAPISSLPEVKRLSSFGSDVLGQSTPTAQPTSALDSQRPSLQHSSSFGLQSAVHQAFDVPETPDSTRDSVSRSNSDSTSLISPIIGSRPVDDQKTPTIAEEPGESVSTPADTPGGVAFKPGHRRDISLPSPDNNPSKKPSISESVPYPQSANAEMSSTDPSRDYFQLYRPSVEPYGTSEESQPQGNDLPAPLRPNNSSQAKADGAEDSLPVIVPTISNDNSPEDTENDRLRREIIRSLSRENSPSEEPDRASGSEPQQSASLNPNEYESHRGNETGRPALEPEEPKSGAQLQSSGPPKTFDELLSDTPPIPEPATEQAPKPKLSRRFSWESSSSEEIPPTADFGASPQQTAPPLGQAPPASDNQLDPEPLPNYQETTSDEDALGSRPSTEKPKLTIIPPSTVDESSVSDRHLPEVMYDEAAQSVPPVVDGSADQALVPVSAPPPPSVEPTLLGFRDILGIKSASERVQSFDRTRDQFSAIDTGLNHWIQVTVNAHPEHLDTVQQSLKSAGSAPKPSMSKGKFPKLSSLGNLASSLHDAGPSGSLHTRRGSTHVMNRQQVEQRGKDLLHSAGVLGGRAGGAAKGFFAKGKSKLNRGGADKVDT